MEGSLMSSTQIELGRIDVKTIIAAYNHNIEQGRHQLTAATLRSDITFEDRENHLLQAKYHFISAARNAQGAINPKTTDRKIDFYDQEKLREAISLLCDTFTKSLTFHWRSSLPILNIIGVHSYGLFRRQEYNPEDEYVVIKEIDCGAVPLSKKQQIADTICDCILECFNSYSTSTLKRQAAGLDDLKEFRTFLRLAKHYHLNDKQQTGALIFLRCHGIELEGLEKLDNSVSIGKLIYG